MKSEIAELKNINMKRYEDAKNLVKVVTWNNTYKLRVDEEFELM